MIPNSFEYVKAHSIAEAITLLKKHGDEAKLLAGGHSLIPAMKLRLSGPKTLIDISHIRELNKISVKNRMVHIGANVTHRAVENSKLVKKNCLVLSEAAGKIGDPQVRNRGTIGGSLAHADPAADYPALILALGAEICVERKRSCREISADDFFTGLFETALKDGEMISKVSFPVLKKRTGAAYEKFPHPASRFAVVGVAAMVSLDRNGKCKDARVAVTGAAANAFRATKVEKALFGKRLGKSMISDASKETADASEMLSDLFASAEYRAHLCSVLTERVLMTATKRAK